MAKSTHYSTFQHLAPRAKDRVEDPGIHAISRARNLLVDGQIFPEGYVLIPVKSFGVWDRERRRGGLRGAIFVRRGK